MKRITRVLNAQKRRVSSQNAVVLQKMASWYVLLLSLWMWRDGSVSIPRIVKQALDGCLDAEDCC